MRYIHIREREILLKDALAQKVTKCITITQKTFSLARMVKIF